MSDDNEAEDIGPSGPIEIHGVHPYFEDSVAQRIYACTHLFNCLDDLEYDKAKDAVLDLIGAVMRSIADQPKPISRVK